MKKLFYLCALATALTVAGCGDKTGDPTPPAAPGLTARASYALDGQPVTVTAASTTYTPAAGAGGAGAVDLMTIMLSAQPTGGATEYVRVIFAKAPGAAESTYRPISLAVDGIAGRRGGEYNNPNALTLTKSAAGWSGTFEGAQLGSGGQIVSTVRSGVFTNVRP